MTRSKAHVAKLILAQINLRRMMIAFLFMFGVEVLFLLYVERIRLDESAGDELTLIWVSYLLHFVLAVFLIFSVGTAYYAERKAKASVEFKTRLPMICVWIALIISAVISMFDQMTIGHITLFTAKLLVFGLLIYIQPRWQWLVYGVPFAIFLFGIFLFQSETDLLITHLINGTVVFAGVMVASTLFYRYKYNDIFTRLTLKRMNRTLEKLSTLDALTTLPNRRYFEAQIQYELAINRRYGHTASLLLMDIDYFKTINDTYGHDVGDRILKELGAFLTNNVRESDTVCRWGGEEFMILLSHTDLEGAQKLAIRLKDSISDMVFLPGEKDIALSVSIGVTELVHERKDAFDYSYNLVDKALYEAKTQGRNRVRTKK